jgi:hypothetical protein
MIAPPVKSWSWDGSLVENQSDRRLMVQAGQILRLVSTMLVVTPLAISCGNLSEVTSSPESVARPVSGTSAEMSAPVATGGALDPVAHGNRYDVCPGCAHTELTTTPWNSLRAGSVVNIFYRATPYKTKFALRVSGTAAAPIVINGVLDESGNRPVISGDGAVTAKANANTGIYSEPTP